MFDVIRKFREKNDGGHIYEKGDTYPRAGWVPPEGRAESLCEAKKTEHNVTGKKYLKAQK